MIRKFNRLSPTVKGMLLMVLATIAFTAMQAGIRIVASDPDYPLPPLEIAFFRNLFGLIALAPMFLKVGTAAFRTRRIGLHLVRAGFQAAGMVCFFTALTMIPMSEVTALSFSAPLFATVFAVIWLGERIRMRRISALIVGFIGVLIVLRPGFEVISLGASLVLVSSLTWAIAMTFIKTLSRTDSALTLTLYAGLFMSLATLIPALLVWTQPTLSQLGWLLGIGAVGTVGHLAFAQAFKIADMSAVLPLDFLRLVWASAMGFWLFAEVPTGWSLAGGTVIFAAACYIAYREATMGRRSARESDPSGADNKLETAVSPSGAEETSPAATVVPLPRGPEGDLAPTRGKHPAISVPNVEPKRTGTG